MDPIKQAIERAKGFRNADGQPPQHMGAGRQFPPHAAGAAQTPYNEVTLNGARLTSKRIISHDILDPRSKSFDILRTQVLQTMDAKSWQIIGVTSPSAGCGKSVIATNLALSIARQPDRPVLLVDLDLRKPQVASNLGLRCNTGVVNVLQGSANLSSAIVKARIGSEQIFVLPCEMSVLNSSEWMASRSMSAVLHDIKRDYRPWIVIVDLPPILPSDDVLTVLPQIDCVLFVAAAGITTVAEIKECNKHLESTPVVRVVLNRAVDAVAKYYAYPKTNAPLSRANINRGHDYNYSRRSSRPISSSIKGVAASSSRYVSRLVDRIARF
jgi:protein-tyrosine kinase